MEAVTGPITLDEMTAEIGFFARLLEEFHHPEVIIEFGAGCDWDQVGPLDETKLSTCLLFDYFGTLLQKGIFTFGRSDLVVKTGDKNVQILLCDFRDIHCRSSKEGLFAQLCRRWAEIYPQSFEVITVKNRKRHRLLSGSKWAK